MRKSDLVAFKIEQAGRQKLDALAAGLGCTVSEVMRELVRRAPVVEVQRTVVIEGLKFAEDKDAWREFDEFFANDPGTEQE